MKRFTSILAVLALSSAAQAADTVDMKWNAEMRTRYTNDNAWGGNKGDKQTAAGTYNSFGQRNKLGLGLTKGENFQGQVTLINHFFWGNTADRTGAAGTNPGTISSASAGNVLLVNEAYGWWKASDMASLKFGRSGFEIAGGFVASTQDWLANPYSYDGLWSMWSFEPVSLTLFGTKVADANTEHATTANTPDPEIVNYGAIVGFKTLPEAIKKAEIHLVQTNDERTTWFGTNSGTTNWRTETLRYGFIIGGDVSNFDYRGVADLYTGKAKRFDQGSSTDYDMTGSMFDIALGYTLQDVMMLRFGAFYHMDSGGETANAQNKSFKSYKPGQYDTFNVGGTLMDAVTWGNLTYMGLGVSIKPAEDLTAGLKYTMFTRTNDKDQVTVYGNNAGLVTSGASNDIGNEIDLTLAKNYGDNFQIWALYGMFTPGDLVKNDGTIMGAASTTIKEETHTRLQIQGKLTF